MTTLITLLGIVAILLTAVGSYRFSHYFFASGQIPILIAAGATLSFVILFPYIILITGLAVLAVPLIVVGYKTNVAPSVSNKINDIKVKIDSKSNQANNPNGNSDGSDGSLDPYSTGDSNDEKPIDCPNSNCQNTFDGQENVPDYCGHCGYKIGDTQ